MRRNELLFELKEIIHTYALTHTLTKTISIFPFATKIVCIYALVYVLFFVLYSFNLIRVRDDDVSVRERERESFIMSLYVSVCAQKTSWNVCVWVCVHVFVMLICKIRIFTIHRSHSIQQNEKNETECGHPQSSHQWRSEYEWACLKNNGRHKRTHAQHTMHTTTNWNCGGDYWIPNILKTSLP